jgi:aquaporin Z
MANRRAAAEFVGTFVLMFGGVGSAVIAGEAIGNLGAAFAFGLSLLAMAYAIGPISGCHINPAVTAGLLLSKRMKLDEAVRYWIAQALGAIAAALVLFIVIKARPGDYDSPRRASAPTATVPTRRRASRSARRCWSRSS